MNMDLLHIAYVASVMCLAGIIQSAVGFAFALFAMPLLIWIGMPLPNAMATVAVCSLIQAVLGAGRLRDAVPWRLSLITTGVRLVTVVAGLFILRRLTVLSTNEIRLVVGCILCCMVGIQFTGRKRPAETVHWIWGGLAFTTSGLLSGICGMGGPPLVLWALAHDWPVRKIRGFLFAVYAASIPAQVVLLYLMFGSSILRSSVVALLLSPAVFLGVVIGLPLGNRMPKRILRKIVYMILLAIGLNSIVQPLVQYLR